MKTLLFFLLTLAISAAPPAEFAYRKTLSFPATTNPILAVPLDAEVYASCRQDYADLRVLSADQEPIPYHLERQSIHKTSTELVSLNSEVTGLQQLPDNTLEFYIHQKSGEQVDELRFTTHLRDFEHQVEIAVRESDSWRVIVPDALIFDYTRFYDLRQLSVPVPAQGGRDYRVRVSNISDERRSPHRTLTRSTHNDGRDSSSETQVLETRPFRVERVSLWHRHTRTQEEPKIQPHLIRAESASVDPKTNETHILIHSQRQPITRFELVTDATNWSREVIVEIPHEQGWRVLGRANCSRIVLPEVTRESLAVAIPETRSERYRMRIINRDSPALRPDDLHAVGPAHQLLLLARDLPAELLYAAEFATAPQYDIAQILDTLRVDYQPVVGALSAEFANAEFAVPSGWRQHINSGRFLTQVLLVMVVLLGFGLYRGARRLERTED